MKPHMHALQIPPLSPEANARLNALRKAETLPPPDSITRREIGRPVSARQPGACPVCREHAVDRICQAVWIGPFGKSVIIGGPLDPQYEQQEVRHACANCGVTLEKLHPDVRAALGLELSG